MFTQQTLNQLQNLYAAVTHPVLDNNEVTVMQEDSLMMLCVNDDIVRGAKFDRELLDTAITYHAHHFVEAPGDIQHMTMVNNKGGWMRIIHAGRKLDADVLMEWAKNKGYSLTQRA